MQEILKIIQVNTPEDGCENVIRLMKDIGLKTNLKELNIKEKDVELIIANGFNPERIKNNPRLVTEESLRNILNQIL
jgi:alcohol dehydrogenase class IV